MNPTAATTEETTRSIECYLTANPGNEPMGTLGMTADRRIVRLAEQDESQRPELRRVLEHQLEALLPPEIDGTVRKRMIENTLSTDFQNYQERIRWDRQIRNRLSYLKDKYAAQFAIMNERTKTTFAPNGLTETGGMGQLENGDRWEYDFNNLFTRTQWELQNNFKRGTADAKDFFMSNVIAHQFEQTFLHNGLLLELPKIIKRHDISNRQTCRVLGQYKNKYRSDDFWKDFLENTVNGKSTVRVAEDLGLIINRLTVTWHDIPIDAGDCSDICIRGSSFLSVYVHVSPDKAVYSA